MAGTDPLRAASVLRLVAERLDPARLRLSWLAVPGRVYSLDASTVSDADFTSIRTLGPLPPGVSATMTVSEPIPEKTTRFYRVRVLP
jgi:hypothetical protein